MLVFYHGQERFLHSLPPPKKKKKLWKLTPLYFVIMRSKHNLVLLKCLVNLQSWGVLKC